MTMRIKILYEDKNILAIEKPSGVMVHHDGKTKEKTISDWIIKNYPKLKGVGEPATFNEKEIDRPGIVHRLDKETFGVLIVVKTKEAFAYLKRQFMDRKIKKTYYAIVSGWVKKDHAIINKPIGRSPKDFRKKLAGRGVRGELREAITEYKVLKRFKVPVFKIRPGLENFKRSELGETFSFLEIHPKTGRTHQIRVHMKYINHPIVGDTLYNPKGSVIKGLNRMALHASIIEFRDPKGKIIKIESSLPKEFQEVIK